MYRIRCKEKLNSMKMTLLSHQNNTKRETATETAELALSPIWPSHQPPSGACSTVMCAPCMGEMREFKASIRCLDRLYTSKGKLTKSFLNYAFQCMQAHVSSTYSTFLLQHIHICILPCQRRAHQCCGPGMHTWHTANNEHLRQTTPFPSLSHKPLPRLFSLSPLTSQRHSKQQYLQRHLQPLLTPLSVA